MEMANQLRAGLPYLAISARTSLSAQKHSVAVQ